MNNPRVIFMEAPVADGGRLVKILAAGPVTHQPHSSIFRIVLAWVDSQLVVWSQRFVRDGDGELRHRGFDCGEYFDDTELTEAAVAFAGRIKRDSGSYVSVYRE